MQVKNLSDTDREQSNPMRDLGMNRAKKNYHDNIRFSKHRLFDLQERQAFCFVRNVNMRTTTFEMQLLGISDSEARVRDFSRVALVYQKNANLQITLDIYRLLFERPICATYKITSVEVFESGEKVYGLSLISVDPWHQEPFKDGIGRLSDV